MILCDFRREMNVIKKYSILKQLALTLDCYIPRLGLFLTILTYTSFGNYINAEKVYLITAYYNVLRNSMIFGFSMGKIIGKLKNKHFLIKNCTFPQISKTIIKRTSKINNKV